MTRPRRSTGRELYGMIGRIKRPSEVRKAWNDYFRKEGIDASMDIYPTSVETLPERLSEMFHFDRRGYLVGVNLSRSLAKLLDHVEPAAKRRGVIWVENRSGVLWGFRECPLCFPA